MIDKILKENLHEFGSELGLGLFLYTLAVSIRAQHILEIGRHKGFSTLALCKALEFLEIGWIEPDQHKQRDIDYENFESPKRRRVVSLDPASNHDAKKLLTRHGVEKHGILLEMKSDQFNKPDYEFDLCFIDGDHTEAQTLKDLRMCFDFLKDGGYVVIHDWFYDGISPIQRAIKEFLRQFGTKPQILLIDTGYMSFAVLRKNGSLYG